MLADIQRLSVAERIQLVEDIWDTIAAQPDALTLTETQRDVLDQRLEAWQQNLQEGITWPELKAKMTNR